jgi:hypothetical protein
LAKIIHNTQKNKAMKVTNCTTLATSQTLEGINNLINKYFYSNIELRPKPNILTGNKSQFFDLYNSKGLINSFTVIKDSKFRFLMKN